MENSYISVDTQTILNDSIQLFDIYYQYGEGNMVLYSAGGEKVSEEVRCKIPENLASRLYIRQKDKLSYNLYVEKNLRKMLIDDTVDTSAKAKAAYSTVVFLAEILFKEPKADIIRRYKQTIMNTLEFVLKDNSAFFHLLDLTTFDYTTYNHSVNVGIFSMGLMNEFLGKLPEYDLPETVAGFFLHDIGKCGISPDILNKKGPLLKVEWEILKSHVERGVKILTANKALTKESEVIVMEHHELDDGSGYPRQLTGNEIHISAKICSIADIFDGLTSARPWRKAYSSYEALRIMKNDIFKHFDPEYFLKFVNLFSHPKI
jgi:HD-GYP domain-containing protein (c-di-GMP phosphodiesterase class II)